MQNNITTVPDSASILREDAKAHIQHCTYSMHLKGRRIGIVSAESFCVFTRGTICGFCSNLIYYVKF
jgi:hypothetical protein